MSTISSFTIHNSSAISMTLIHEPECFEYELPLGEEAVIEFDSGGKSVYLRWDSTADGKTSIAILDDNSSYSVYSRGVNVFAEYLT